MPEKFLKNSVPFEKVCFGDFREFINLSHRKNPAYESER
jgi:hypothetical protein